MTEQSIPARATPNSPKTGLLICLVLGGLVGYGAGRLQASFAADAARHEIESAREDLKRAKDSVTPTQTRAFRAESYILLENTRIALEAGDDDEATKNLRVAQKLLATNAEGTPFEELAVKLKDALEAGDAGSRRAAVQAVQAKIREINIAPPQAAGGAAQ